MVPQPAVSLIQSRTPQPWGESLFQSLCCDRLTRIIMQKSNLQVFKCLYWRTGTEDLSDNIWTSVKFWSWEAHPIEPGKKSLFSDHSTNFDHSKEDYPMRVVQFMVKIIKVNLILKHFKEGFSSLIRERVLRMWEFYWKSFFPGLDFKFFVHG